MTKFKEQLNRAKEIRDFYILAKKYGFVEGNPEIVGYIDPCSLIGQAPVLHAGVM